jgi:hypothetical protein
VSGLQPSWNQTAKIQNYSVNNPAPTIFSKVSRWGQDLVYSILACIFHFEEWSTLQKTYFDVKKKLTAEYGTPTEVEEKFLITPRNDDEKFQAVVDGKCSYKASFVTKLGDIDISISVTEDLGPTVLVQFTDNENALK